MPDTRDAVEAAFPGLRGTAWRISSPVDARYNCLSFAVGVEDRFWWPTSKNYWPQELATSAAPTLSCFRELFVDLLGFEECDNDTLEPGQTKVALFVRGDAPKHAARQLSTGQWQSKLGQDVDIVHELRALEGDTYRVVRILFRIQTQQFLGRRSVRSVRL